MRLTIQHGETVFEPPILSGVTIERERKGSPSVLTFTTVKIMNGGMDFSEGDAVCFYYNGEQVFMGYVFTKQRDKEHHIKVTCYDQMRYLKNNYTYIFQNKTASQIIKAMCSDINLKVGEFDDTKYIIPSLTEENKSLLDISLSVLEDTLVHTGQLYVLYDDFGQLTLKNCKNMKSDVLIDATTAENFDYSTSIDKETYDSVMLYYKEDDHIVKIYHKQNEDRIKQWGLLRYYEEVDNKDIAENKAKQLLDLYCRKTRELKISKAFGHTSIRGGTLIPIRLNLGDIQVDNYFLVDKVVHNFEESHYTMDLTVSGAWDE